MLAFRTVTYCTENEETPLCRCHWHIKSLGCGQVQRCELVGDAFAACHQRIEHLEPRVQLASEPAIKFEREQGLQHTAWVQEVLFVGAGVGVPSFSVQ